MSKRGRAESDRSGRGSGGEESATRITIRDLPLEYEFNLPRPARRIARVHTQIQDLTAQALSDEVQVSGTLRKRVFFVDESGQWSRACSDSEVTAVLDCPGTEAGDEVKAAARVVQLSATLDSPQEAVQRAVIRFRVRTRRAEGSDDGQAAT